MRPKYYYIDAGCMGYVPQMGRYILFATYRDYIDYLES